MPSPHRATRASVRRLRPEGRWRDTARPDFTSRLRAAERTLRGRLARRDVLLDLMCAVGATLDPEEIATSITERVASWIPAPSWALVSSDRSGHATSLATRALDPALQASVHAVAQWVMANGAWFATADLRQDARIVSDASGAAVAVPLTSRGAHIGAIVGLDPAASAQEPRLAPATARALRTLLEPAAAALDTALLLSRAEALSVTDDLTDLYNSRYLNQALRRESKRAARGNRPLSLLFIDLDGFKSINDTHGHLCGSRALVEAGAVIRGAARETDIVARFGGDEFALVLPDTGGPGALAVAERVRDRIARHPFLGAEGLSLSLTASVGVATLPDVASSPDGLVQAADAAMYAVKARGKNGVHAAATSADK